MARAHETHVAPPLDDNDGASRAPRAKKASPWGSRHPAHLRPRPRGVSALLAPGRATHAGGGGPIEPGEGCRGATRGFWPRPPSRAALVREQASARPDLPSPQLGRRVEAARLLLEGLRGQLVVRIKAVRG